MPRLPPPPQAQRLTRAAGETRGLAERVLAITADLGVLPTAAGVGLALGQLMAAAEALAHAEQGLRHAADRAMAEDR